MRTIADIDDFALLRRFVEEDSQEAFSRLVNSHLDLVYAVCLRETNDPALAQDVAQAVFLTLFHKAPTIKKGTVLAGWLFNTSRFAAKNAMRQEKRRKAVEDELVEAMSQGAGPMETWQAVEPFLNEAIASLGAKEREAVLLRYFEDKSMKEVGLQLNVTEHAAQMRVSRAIEKIKRHLRRNGIAVPVALLSTLFAEHAARAAPASCIHAVGHLVFGLAREGAAVSSGLTAAKAHGISQGVMKSMLVNKLKVAAMVVTLSVTGVVGVVSSRSSSILSQASAQQVMSVKASAPSRSPDEMMRFIVAGIAAARSRSRSFSIQADLTRNDFTPKEKFALLRSIPGGPPQDFPHEDDNLTQTAMWYRMGTKSSLELHIDPSNSRRISLYKHIVTEGEVTRLLEQYKGDPEASDKSQYWMGYVLPSSQALDDNFWKVGSEFNIFVYLYSGPGGRPLDELFKRKDSPGIFEGEEAIDGTLCAKIETLSVKGGYPTFFWIDTRHGFILRRMEIFEPLGDGSKTTVLRKEMRSSDVTESNGVWLPRTIEVKEYDVFPKHGVLDPKAVFPEGLTKDSFVIEGDLAKLPVETSRLTINAFKTNISVPPSVWKLEWPKGTHVRDAITQKVFTVR